MLGLASSDHLDPLASTQAGSLIAGAIVGGYYLVSVLGEGGMGVVWSARDPRLDRMIALKVRKPAGASPAQRRRFLREARAMARVKHPNVRAVYEVGTDGAWDFIAMELVDGETLDAWLASGPPRDHVIAALLAAGRGLAAAHAAGVVHSDVKPDNILRGRDGSVLLADFGLSRGSGDAAAMIPPITVSTSDSSLDSSVTSPGAMIGTPAFMAPELYAGAMPDMRTDQFAFCVTAWRALTGARPYRGRTFDELRRAVNAGVAGVVTDLPAPIRAVLARGLDPDPAKRWPDVASLLAALDRATHVRRPRWLTASSASARARPCEARRRSR